MKTNELFAALSMPPILLAAVIFCTAGCENKEKVLDIETPGGQLEIERDRDTGEVEIDASRDKKMLDINTPGADVEIQRDRDSGRVNVDVSN